MGLLSRQREPEVPVFFGDYAAASNRGEVSTRFPASASEGMCNLVEAYISHDIEVDGQSHFPVIHPAFDGFRDGKSADGTFATIDFGNDRTVDKPMVLVNIGRHAGRTALEYSGISTQDEVDIAVVSTFSLGPEKEPAVRTTFISSHAPDLAGKTGALYSTQMGGYYGKWPDFDPEIRKLVDGATHKDTHPLAVAFAVSDVPAPELFMTDPPYLKEAIPNTPEGQRMMRELRDTGNLVPSLVARVMNETAAARWYMHLRGPGGKPVLLDTRSIKLQSQALPGAVALGNLFPITLDGPLGTLHPRFENDPPGMITRFYSPASPHVHAAMGGGNGKPAKLVGNKFTDYHTVTLFDMHRVPGSMLQAKSSDPYWLLEKPMIQSNENLDSTYALLELDPRTNRYGIFDTIRPGKDQDGVSIIVDANGIVHTEDTRKLTPEAERYVALGVTIDAVKRSRRGPAPAMAPQLHLPGLHVNRYMDVSISGKNLKRLV